MTGFENTIRRCPKTMSVVALPFEFCVQIALFHARRQALTAPERRRGLHIFNIEFVVALAFVIAVVEDIAVFFELCDISHIVVIDVAVGKLSVRQNRELAPIARQTFEIFFASEKCLYFACLIATHPISWCIVVFKQSLYGKFGHEFCRH